MKKLLIAVCALGAAVIANAATVTWSAAQVREYNSSAMAGSSYAAYFISEAAYSHSDAVTALGKGDISFLSNGVGYATFKDNPSTGAGLGGGSGTITTTAGNPETFTGYLVILDSTAAATAEHVYITDVVSGSTGATSGQSGKVNFGNLTGTATASNWYAVPEPTSGLLLLLGVGALALRRRRA